MPRNVTQRKTKFLTRGFDMTWPEGMYKLQEEKIDSLSRRDAITFIMAAMAEKTERDQTQECNEY